VAGFTINRVVVSGNLTRDPEMRALPSGTSLCQLGIAVNERVKDQSGNWSDRPNYFDVTVWAGVGEWVAKNLSKGDGIVIEGRLRFEQWEKDGQKRSRVSIVADSVVPMPRDRSSNGGGPSARSDVPSDTYGFGQPQPGSSYAGAGAPAGGAYGAPRPGADDDIPF
jgi:single-strand DNA-binding protein